MTSVASRSEIIENRYQLRNFIVVLVSSIDQTMNIVYLIISLFVGSLAQSCQQGNILLFTNTTQVYALDTNARTVSKTSIDLDCVPLATTFAGNDAVLTCSDKHTIQTIGLDNSVSSFEYQSPCLVSTLSYEEDDGLNFLTPEK